jgi:hypothetical protein
MSWIFIGWRQFKVQKIIAILALAVVGSILKFSYQMKTENIHSGISLYYILTVLKTFWKYSL